MVWPCFHPVSRRTCAPPTINFNEVHYKVEARFMKLNLGKFAYPYSEFDKTNAIKYFSNLCLNKPKLHYFYQSSFLSGAWNSWQICAFYNPLYSRTQIGRGRGSQSVVLQCSFASMGHSDRREQSAWEMRDELIVMLCLFPVQSLAWGWTMPVSVTAGERKIRSPALPGRAVLWSGAVYMSELNGQIQIL